MQLLIFSFYRQQTILLGVSLGGLKWSVFHLVASATKWPRICAPHSLSTLVGSNGLGPSTSRLSGVCSNQLSYEPACGGGNRVRTDDPLLAGQVLYQLSYTPIRRFRSFSAKINAPISLGALLLKTNKKKIILLVTSDRLRIR